MSPDTSKEVKDLQDSINDQVSFISALKHKKTLMESLFFVLAGFFLITLVVINIGSAISIAYLSFQVILLGKMFYDIQKIKHKLGMERAALTLIEDMRSGLYDNSFVPKYLHKA